MSLTVTEASAVNVVLRHLYGVPGHVPAPTPTDVQVADAARVLAASAHKRLAAGFRPEDVRLHTDEEVPS